MSTPQIEHSIHSSVDQAVHVLQISRPAKKNALTDSMYSKMGDALVVADSNPDVRVHVIHGSDVCFTAGNDLKDFLAHPPTGESSPVYNFLNALIGCSKPVVAGIAGPAVGIGTTMLLHCDLLVADETAVFQLPFVDLGLCPEAGSSYLLPHWLGYHRAAGLLLTGDRFGAEDAMQMGLLYEIAEPGQAVSRAVAIAADLAAKPSASLVLTKELLRSHTKDVLAMALQTETKNFVARLQSSDAKEAFQAFLEKRKPRFNQD